MRRVVVTGLGVVAPTGNSSREAWKNAVEARSGVAKIQQFDASDLPVQIAGEVNGLDPSDFLDPKEVKRTSRFVLFALAAAREAMEASGLIDYHVPERFGCCIGVGMGALSDIENNALTLKQSGYRKISPFFIPYAIPNMASGVVSIKYGLKGPNTCTTTACASGTHAIGEGFDYIRYGKTDVMLVGGAESTVSPLGIASFNALKALSKNNADPEGASRPFDSKRDGFVMGEGAGLLVLEELEHARQRGAEILAEVVGYGLSSDGNHITAPAPEHEGGLRCMQMAIDSAEIAAADIDYINAHGTSTKLNDLYESRAIAKLLGSHSENVSISSTKGVTGHCIGAAGGIEAAYTVLALKENIVPPTANLFSPDTMDGLDYTPLEAREKRLGVALSNSFGFGGTNASIAFKSY